MSEFQESSLSSFNFAGEIVNYLQKAYKISRFTLNFFFHLPFGITLCDAKASMGILYKPYFEMWPPEHLPAAVALRGEDDIFREPHPQSASGHHESTIISFRVFNLK